jgi:signal transduction histidine kinase/ActR/RegA family two-component response regulator
MSYRWAAFGAILVLLLVFNAWLALQTSQRVFAQQEQSRFGLRVEARINTVLSLAKDIETGTRGYLVSGDDLYLAPYAKAANGLNAQLSLLGPELERFPDSSDIAMQLFRSISALLDQAQSAIDARAKMGSDPVVSELEPLLSEQKRRMDALRANADLLRDQQSQVNVGLEQELERTRRDAQVAVLVPSGLSVLLAGLLLTLISRDFRRSELLNAERNRLLAQERRARTEAEAASQARDDFVSAVSHELRTPLQSILGWAQFTRRELSRRGETSGSSLDSALASVERSTRQLSAMVDNLLDASQALSGRIVLHPGDTDLGGILRSTIESLEPAARAKGVALNLVIGERSLRMVGDTQRLRQVAINLIGNAVKFTASGGRVTVHAWRDASQLHFSVRDTGIGIRGDLLPLVFQRYVQGSESTTRQHGGLGLGLALVKHLIEMHGGRIVAASDGIGRGAEFSVSLPAQIAAAEPAAETRSALHEQHLPFAIDATPSPTQLARLPGLRLLVVDDDADVRSVLEQLLAEEGAQVRAAASVVEAMNALRTSRVDVVLSDIGMPDMDGYALARAVRAMAQSGSATPASTPMIALTAFSRAEDERRALDNGFNAHLGKPIDIERLIDVVKRYTAGSPENC